MKNAMRRLMMVVPSMAIVTAGFIFGKTCRFWLYEPPVPAKLRERED